MNFAETQEQDLVQCLVDECIQIHGIEIYYIPRTLVDEDYLFGEDNISNYNAAISIECYLETFEGWDGEGDILSKFGLIISNTAKLVMSRKRFTEEITSQFSTIKEPEEGDLIYFPLTDALFEIQYSSEENPFYQIGKNYTYTLSIEKFAYSYETIDTGITEIDNIETQYSNLDDAGNSQGDNANIEAEADGSADDAFDDTGTDDRGTGTIDFSETDPFLNY